MFSLDAIETLIPPSDGFRRAPTERWNPSVCGDIDIRIAADGHWFHEGSVIRRPGLIRLLSSVLVQEDGQYWLKTPAEKLRLVVDDAPFVVQDLRVDQETENRDGPSQMTLRTNVGEDLTLTQPWSLKPTPEGDSLPWVPVAQGLYARLSRNLYYHLCHQAMAENSPDTDGVLYWHAAGQDWPLGRL